MQSSEQQYFSQNPPGPGPPPTGQGGHNGYTYNNDTHFSSVLSEMPPNVNHLLPFQNVNFRPSETCPRNFIIFDRTDNRSQIMYHPGLAQKSCFPAGLNIGSPWLLQDNLRTNEVLFSSFIKEDSDDIEALLSLEEENEEEEEEYEDEEVSTARTCNYGSDSDDSCSSKPRKSSKLLPTSSPHRSSTGTGKSRKREKMRKMVKALRGMVPDSNNMNSVDVLDVLDEAVKYLKSLKVEVQKVGVGNSKN